MADTRPSNTWVEILKGLPVSLSFILIVDWVLLKYLVDLYKFQVGASDPNMNYTIISIAALVLVNLFIVGSFARIRFLVEKQSITSNNTATNPE